MDTMVSFGFKSQYQMKKVLVDGVFIHNSGSKLILEIIIERAKKDYDKVVLLRDNRLVYAEKESLKEIEINGIFRVVIAALYRMIGYDIIGVNSLGCLIPGIYKWVYFHNATLLEKSSTDFLRFNYFKFSSRIVSTFLVQTEHMRFKLLERGVKNVQVLPLFDLVSFKDLPLESARNDYMYIGAYYPHKNVELLLEGWFRFKDKYELDSILYLTLDNMDFSRLIDSRKAECYDVHNLGWLPKKDLLKECKKVKNFINLSSIESFGLPYLEVGAMYERRMMSLRLAHLDDIVSGLLYVDNNVESVSHGLNELLHTDVITNIKIVDQRQNLFK
jgi:hypothetical protein